MVVLQTRCCLREKVFKTKHKLLWLQSTTITFITGSVKSRVFSMYFYVKREILNHKRIRLEGSSDCGNWTDNHVIVLFVLSELTVVYFPICFSFIWYYWKRNYFKLEEHHSEIGKIAIPKMECYWMRDIFYYLNIL